MLKMSVAADIESKKQDRDAEEKKKNFTLYNYSLN